MGLAASKLPKGQQDPGHGSQNELGNAEILRDQPMVWGKSHWLQTWREKH